MTLENVMTFGDALTSPCGLRYMYDALELQSGASRRRLLAEVMLTDTELISKAYVKLEAFYRAFANDSCATDRLRSKLTTLKDITATIERLKSGSVLDDMELFEIKALAFLAGEAGRILSKANIDEPSIPDLAAVADFLDPDGQRVPTFYIYDSYSPELAALRNRIRQTGDSSGELFAQASGIEDKVRKELSEILQPHAQQLNEAIDALTETDILLAKALQASAMHLSFPTISADGGTAYEGLWHPATAYRLQAQGKDFQRVNISFAVQPTVIVGANMGGKTVTLKAVGLAQYLFQFGFAIPACRASIAIKDNVKLCIGEEDLSCQGLSAFAAEIRRIDDILSSARAGNRDLALIDEPARTTNPQEGTALVKALVKQMKGLSSSILLTTHYDLGRISAHRLRVRGIVNGKMDYSLLEAGNGAVPHEALSVAESLGADRQWIETARNLIKKETKTVHKTELEDGCERGGDG